MEYIKLNSMDELPSETKKLLVKYHVPNLPGFTWSIELYSVIKVDDSIYYTDKCSWIPKVKHLKSSSIRLIYLMDAIINNGVVTKNRYGIAHLS